MSRELFYTESAEVTKRLGFLLGEELRLSFPGEHATVVALSGELGAGKTFFTKGIAEGLGIRSRVQSPTFVLMKRYSISKSVFHDLWHVDCYRIGSVRELRSLGFKNILEDPGNIVVIEWPERIAKILPHKMLRISFAHDTLHTRSIEMRS
mgnify:FL=1